MKKNITITVLLFAVLGCLYGQESTEDKPAPPPSFIPEAGDFSGAILFGRSMYNYLPPSDIVGTANTSWSVQGNAPTNQQVGVFGNGSISNMVGGEARYFITSMIAAKVSGGAIFSNTPGKEYRPALIDPSAPNYTWIPAYQETVAESKADVFLNVGGEYHFATKYDRLSPYVGLNIPFFYGRISQYNPKIVDFDSDGDPLEQPDVIDVGIRNTEQVGIGVQAVAGIDYYLMEGFYFGFEIKPISHLFLYNNKVPGPGYEGSKAANTNWSFFSQSFFKIGFRF